MGIAKESWFPAFNQDWNYGAGNPPNPDGSQTDYLWKRILIPGRLTEILENYAPFSRRFLFPFSLGNGNVRRCRLRSSPALGKAQVKRRFGRREPSARHAVRGRKLAT